MVECAPWPKDGKYKDFGEVWQYLNDRADQYNDCAKRHNAWVEFERKKVTK